MLFSEPKIPQSFSTWGKFYGVSTFQCSSASRKFLKNMCARDCTCPSDVSVLFSEPKIPQIELPPRRETLSDVFQCSSASRKFLKPSPARFDAGGLAFQCSSASRKFLKRRVLRAPVAEEHSFSALQRAENSSK